MAMTVTATMSGTASNQHIYLWIRVLTGAVETGGAAANGIAASGGTTVTASLTPNFSHSLPVFAITADNWGGTYTAATNNAIDSQSADADTWGAGFGRYTGTVTASTPVTFGASGVNGSCDYGTWACYEIQPSGGSTPSVDGSSPILASATGAGIKTVTSASFTPPAGSVVAVMVCCGGTGSSGSMIMTIGNTGGLSFTQRAGNGTVTDQSTYVFTATVGGGAVAAASTPQLIPPGLRSPAAWSRLIVPQVSVGPPVTPVLNVNAQLATAAGFAQNVPFGTYITGLGGTGAGYFIDNHGAPRMVLGDAAWGLCGNAGRWNSGNWQADYDTFFTNRSTQGFTVIYTKPMGTVQNLGINNDGRTFDPLFPFQGGTPSTGVSNANPSTGLTSAFWARIDYMFASAQARGITVFFNAIGYNSDFNGGPGPLAGKSTTEFTAYGTALGTRYKNTPNLVWNLADDYFGGTTPDSLITAFMTGVRGAGDTHAVAIENMPESDSRKGFARTETCGTTNLSATVTDTSVASSDVGARVTGAGIPANSVINSVTPGVSFVMNNQANATASVTLTILDYGLPWGTSNAQFNFTYSYNATYYGIERAYLESSPLTVIQGDGYFYQGNNVYQGGTGAFAYDHAIRQDAWHAISSGARGIIHGSESTWQYQSTALAASSTDWYYVNNAGKIRTLIESLTGWQTLVPDTGSVLVTAGRGTHASVFLSGGGGGQYEVAFTDTYVTASRGPDSGSGASLAVIYMSHATTITIDQTKMVTGYTAKWVDPVTGATSTATVGSTYNSTAKGNNSAGEADWVLVLQAPTTVSPTAGLATGTGTAQQADAQGSWIATATGTAQPPVPAVGVNAQLATAAGVGQQPAGHTTQLAAAAGIAQPPVPAAGANAQAATATGTAQQAEAQGSWAATAAGAAQPPVPAVGANAQAATATGTAQQAGAQGSWPATATGTAQQPVPAVGVNAQLATAAGAVPPSGLANPLLATAAGAAQQPTVQISGTANAPAQIATGTGSALQAGGQNVQLATAAGAAQPGEAQGSWLATGVGAAQPPVPAAGANAQLATGSGVAFQTVGQNAQAATTAGAAQQAGAQGSWPATGTGTAPGATPAAGVNAGVATGAGAALQAGGQNAQLATSSGVSLQPTVQTSGSANAPAQVATGGGLVSQPTGQGSWPATAVGAAGPSGMAQAQPATGTAAAAQASGQGSWLATGTAAAQQTAGHNTTAASAAGTAQQAGAQGSWPATGTGSAPQAGGQNAQFATATGAAQQPTVQTAGSANAPAQVATGAGAVPPSGMGQAGLATAAGAALDATVSTFTSTSAPAQAATGTGAAQQAGAQGSWVATAAGAAQQIAGHATQLAAANGVAQFATILTGRNAPAVLAAANAAAQQPVVFVQAFIPAQAATGAGQAAAPVIFASAQVIQGSSTGTAATQPFTSAGTPVTQPFASAAAPVSELAGTSASVSEG